jgi:glycosyltransferase involved in cell wall biosynthesis
MGDVLHDVVPQERPMTSGMQNSEPGSGRARNGFETEGQGRRICMVLHGDYPGDVRVRREATAALGAGHSVDVICMRKPGEAASESVAGAGVRRLPMQHVAGPGAVRTVYEYLLFTALASLVLVPAAVRRRYQVIQIHNPPDFLTAAAVLPRLFGSRVILDIHDLSSHMFRARFSGRAGHLTARVLDAIELCACRIAHVVLTVHEAYRGELIAHGVPPDKLEVVMNVADQSLLASVGQRQPAEDPDEWIVAYCGTIAPWYGVELIVEAIDQLDAEIPSARALIMGEGDALEAVRARAAASGSADRIELSGRWLPPEEALARLAQASCGVIPNLPTELNRFALSTKLFEYIGLGLPVVVARLETLETHFGEEEVTFFEAGDSTSLAAALRWIATHPAEARAKTERARARVARDYSWAMNRDRYLKAVEAG